MNDPTNPQPQPQPQPGSESEPRAAQQPHVAVLDREALDAVAERAMAGRTIDLGAVRQRAAARRRRIARQGVGWVAGVAAATALLLVLTSAGAHLLGRPEPPASGGPGALPDRVFAPPPWTPSVTDDPIARAALVLSAPVSTRGWSTASKPAPVLVSADGGQYRTLPGHVGESVSLSSDGTRVAWTPFTGMTSDGPNHPALLRWLATAGGGMHQVDVTEPGLPTEVTATSWSPDDRWIAASLQVQTSRRGAATIEARNAVVLVDANSGRVWRVCPCSNDVAFDRAGRLLIHDPGAGEPPMKLPPEVRTAPMPGDISNTGHMRWIPNVVSADGRSRLLTTKDKTNEGGPPDNWYLVIGRPKTLMAQIVTPTPRTPLGQLSEATPLVWDGADTAWVWVLTANSQPPGGLIWRVRLGSADRPVTILPATGPGAAGVSVLYLAQDVVLGGRTAHANPPSWPWWQPERARWLLIGHPVPALSAAAALVLLLVLLLGLRAVRRVRRHRPTPA